MTADYCSQIPIVHFLKHSLCALSHILSFISHSECMKSALISHFTNPKVPVEKLAEDDTVSGQGQVSTMVYLNYDASVFKIQSFEFQLSYHLMKSVHICLQFSEGNSIPEVKTITCHT